MIARLWHGRVPAEKGDAYYEYMAKTGFADYRESPGMLDLKILRSDHDGETHFLLVTFWDNFGSIEKFAGKNYRRARYYPEDKNYLLELEEDVQHYEVIP